MSGPLATKLPVIAVGDYNSAADGSSTATYALLTDAGLADAWTKLRSPDPGFTLPGGAAGQLRLRTQPQDRLHLHARRAEGQGHPARRQRPLRSRRGTLALRSRRGRRGHPATRAEVNLEVSCTGRPCTVDSSSASIARRARCSSSPR